jgi:large subunit ribosomal protein L3
MNQNPGLIGKKLGNTQIFDDNGDVHRVTVIQAGPCVVLGKRTPDKDGYSAVQLGFGSKREKTVRRPQRVFFEKLGIDPVAVIRELRLPVDAVEPFEVGQTLGVSDVFEVGQLVDVSGQTKGRGYTGVIKRWNFAGVGSVTHGAHEYKRHGGSIGQNMTPGRTFPGMKMPGRYGNERVSILNLRVAAIDPEQNLLAVEGGVPGHRNAIVMVRGAVKAKRAAA